MVTPLRFTGSRLATGVRIQVLPTWKSIELIFAAIC